MRTGSGQLQSHVKSFREGPRKESAVLSRTEHLPYSTLAPRHCERRGRELCAQRYGALSRTYDPLSVSKKRMDTARARRKGELARRGFGRASLAQRGGTRIFFYVLVCFLIKMQRKLAECFSVGSYPPYCVEKLPRSYPPWRVTPAGALNGAKD